MYNNSGLRVYQVHMWATVHNETGLAGVMLEAGGAGQEQARRNVKGKNGVLR